ncbi:PASTA domain-containing protein [Actinoplanes sp. NPDC051859]|uniref:PASTA domain-containing protein n=1 Tax=Actinoplanes sp. NPDC051859 TaxID=3363909 RepID=UPI0037B12665
MSDDTGEFFPFRDEASGESGKHPNERPRKGDDSTQEVPRTPADADRTAMFPAAGDATEIHRPATDDATAVYRAGGDDATTVYRSGGDDATAVHRPAGAEQPDADPVWAGRAGVRGPGSASGSAPGDETRTDWAAAPGGSDQAPNKWWLPIVVGLIAFALLGVLSWGVWLIAQNSGGEEDPLPPPPTATKPAAPSPTAKPSSVAPSSEPPTSQAPSSAPPTTPKDTTIPALRGLSVEAARAALNRSGLNYRLRYVTSTDAPAGTVIESDPAEGQQVPGDTVINLIVASAPTATASAPSTNPSAAGIDED